MNISPILHRLATKYYYLLDDVISVHINSDNTVKIHLAAEVFHKYFDTYEVVSVTGYYKRKIAHYDNNIEIFALEE